LLLSHRARRIRWLADRSTSHLNWRVGVPACIAVALLFVVPQLQSQSPARVSANARLSADRVVNCIVQGACGGDPSGGPPPILVYVVLYGYATFGYVCVHPSGSSCAYDLRSTDAIVMNTSATYTIKAVISNPSIYTFDGWESNAGTFGNRLSAQTSYTPTSAGFLTFAMNQVPTSNWGGVEAAMVGNNSVQMSATWAQGTFTIPIPTYVGCNYALCVNPGQETTGIWVGLGDALGSGRIWQAGVDVDISPTLTPGVDTITINPWYEAWPSNPVYLGSAFHASVGDQIRSTVWGIGSTSYYQLYDLTTGGSSSGSISGSAPTDSAEWVAEDELKSSGGTVTMANTTPIIFTNPDVTVSCGGSACSGLGVYSWLLPLDELNVANVNSLGTGMGSVTQYMLPSAIYSNMTEFVDTYSSA
jgi:hypothetical protein